MHYMAHSTASPSLTIISNDRARPKNAHMMRQWWQKDELAVLLDVYGRHVAAGLWRDYALSSASPQNQKEAAFGKIQSSPALFAVFRHAHDAPLYRVEKYTKPLLYRLRGGDGRVLRQGQNLRALLRYFDRKSLKIFQ